MDVKIRDICGEDVVSRDAGKKFREFLVEHWNEPQLRVFADGLTIASVSFFDEAIGLLMKKAAKPFPEVRAKLRFPDLSPGDRSLLNNVLKTRLEESQNPRT